MSIFFLSFLETCPTPVFAGLSGKSFPGRGRYTKILGRNCGISPMFHFISRNIYYLINIKINNIYIIIVIIIIIIINKNKNNTNFIYLF